jgi:hypothetical protein
MKYESYTINTDDYTFYFYDLVIIPYSESDVAEEIGVYNYLIENDDYDIGLDLLTISFEYGERIDEDGNEVLFSVVDEDVFDMCIEYFLYDNEHDLRNELMNGRE